MFRELRRQVLIQPFWQRCGAGWRWFYLRPWLTIPLLAIPAIWPLHSLGLRPAHDTGLHLARLVFLDNLLRHAVLYPRWIPEMMLGLGYPFLDYFSPVVYYLVEPLHLLGLSLPLALMMTFAGLVLVAGFGAYALARDLFGERAHWAALVTATAYMYAPYLLTNLYVRGALAELGAQALLPWVLWSLRRLLTHETPEHYVLPASLTLAGLPVIHGSTSILLWPVLAGYALILWWHGGHSRAQLGWMILACGAALGASAFYWIPVATDSRYLNFAYDPAHIGEFWRRIAWTWSNFMDTGVAFEYRRAAPFQLGLVQVVLALLGLLAARRRDPEWLYLIAVTVLAGLGGTIWAAPFWRRPWLDGSIQFPFRLLTVMTLPLALFTGAILLPVRRRVYQISAALCVIGLLMAAHTPRIAWSPAWASTGDAISLGEVTWLHARTEGLAMDFAQFRPRWSSVFAYRTANELSIQEPSVVLEAANTYDLLVTVTSSAGGPLRFETIYFPGWTVTLDGAAALQPYPSTNLGLLTIDLSPGAHRLHLAWGGAPLHHIAGGISLLTLAGLTFFAWRRGRPRWLASIPLALLVFGIAAAVLRPRLEAVNQPSQSLGTDRIQLLGYRWERGSDRELYLYPYWYVTQTPPAGTLFRWELRDQTGKVLSETISRPYFNSQDAENWPPGTLVDDAYQILLPPGIPAGTYQLAGQVLLPENGEAGSAPQPIGAVELMRAVPQDPTASVPSQTLDVRFGDALNLTGFRLERNGRPVTPQPGRPAVADPGDTLEYILNWRVLAPLPEDYYGAIHLVDQDGNSLARDDEMAGSLFSPPTSWDSYYIHPDRYRLAIPRDAPGGLYWPLVGVYDSETTARLPIQDAAGRSGDYAYRLPPVKIIGKKPSTTPQHSVNAELDNAILLRGYDLDLPKTGIRPGSTFTLTLYYRARQPTVQDLTQFVHLYSPKNGMAAGEDAPPLGGANPTWSWVPGEEIVEQLPIRVAPDARTGPYELEVGLYDPVTGIRAAARDRAGHSVPDDAVNLTTLPVGD